MIKKIIFIIIISLFVISLLAFSVRGRSGAPIDYQSPEEYSTVVGGPFESSGSTSRYALTEAIVEDGSVLLDEKKARFASPDISGKDGKYFTLFTPGVSFVGVPFYILGKAYQMPQFFAYLATTLFAFVNLFLVAILARRLGAGFIASILSGFLFLFGTNALAYANSFTQHHLSVFVVLLATLNAMSKRNFINNAVFGLLYGVGLLIDIPNGFLMLPALIWILTKNFEVVKMNEKVQLKVKYAIIALLLGLLPALFVFGWYNKATAGSFTSLAQFVGRSSDFNVVTEDVIEEEEKEEESNHGIELPFATRNQLDGLSIYLFSSERSLVYYGPVVLIGLLGLMIAYKKTNSRDFSVLILATVLINIILYSMFGDPTGGWSFGPRYLIPASALLCTGIGVTIKKYRNKISAFLTVLFIILISIYSIGVNILGSITTTQVPPKVEALTLPEPIPYTYEYNWQLLQVEKNASLVYNLYFSNTITSYNFGLYYLTGCTILLLILLSLALLEKRKERTL